MKHVNKVLSILLSLIMIVSLFTIVPFTADAVDSASIYTYTVNNGSATITGLKESVTDTELVIPSEIDGYPVTSIGSRAFKETAITSVTIPDSVTSISDFAFDLCPNLASVTIGDGVKSIGEGAFRKIPITSLNIPDSVTSIGDYAFIACSNLSSLKIGNGVKSIGFSAFVETGITSLRIPNSVTSIADWAFQDCHSLTELTIGSGLTDLGLGMFALCPNLESVTIKDGASSIGEMMFQGCESLTSVTIPDSVTLIDNGAFEYCESLTNVIFVRSYAQRSLRIDYGAFTEVPGTLSYFGYSSKALFDGDTEIEKGTELATLNEKTLTWKESASVPECPYTYTVNNGSVTITGLKESVTDTEFIIPSKLDGYPVTSIGGRAFKETAITSVTIPDSVTSISDFAFDLCPNLASVTIGDGVKSIGEGAFRKIPITSLNIPGNITSIGDYAFIACSNLSSLTIGNGVKSIGQDAFAGTGITSLTIPDSVTSIDNGTFSGCANLTDVTIGNGLTDMGMSIFFCCSNLESVTIKDGASSIGEMMFQGCESLTSVIFVRSSAQRTLRINYDAFAEVPGTLKYSGDSKYALFDGDTEIERGTELAALSGKTLTWKEISYTPTYTVTWKNDDGSTIDTNEVEAGTVPTHAAPTKAADDNYGYIFSSWSPEVSAVTRDVTYTAQFSQVPYVAAVEPYIDESGDYKLGTKAYYIYNGKNYAVNEDGSVGEELDDLTLSYFDFKERANKTYQILHYTGSYDGLDELVIPKTFNGKKITVLGDGDGNAGFMKATGDKKQFTLKLNENITEIKPYAFYAMWVSKVDGDTSGLKTIGLYAFSWVNSPDDYQVDILLDYAGTITADRGILNHDVATLRIKHATKFSATVFNAQSVDYVFTDAHLYGNPTWSWADDYSTATAILTCTDSRCNHEENVSATVTSQTKDGVITYTATAEIDGETYTDTKTAFADGMGARLLGHSISLEGDIAVNFYMELAPEIAQSETAYMLFNIPNTSKEYQSQKVYVKDLMPVEDGYYVFKCCVAAKDMTSTITAQIIDDGKQGTPYTYSVKDYADYLIEHKDDNEQYTKAAPLVEKMLQYGAYAKEYFDNTNTLNNLGDVTIDIAAPVINELPEGTTFEGASLSLKSETTLSLFFNSNEKLTFSCDGYNVETVQSGDYQIARIRGIKAKHIGDILTLNVNGGTVQYSPLNYCKNVLAPSTATPDEAQPQAQDDKLVNVVKALYLYWQAADSYFD